MARSDTTADRNLPASPEHTDPNTSPDGVTMTEHRPTHPAPAQPEQPVDVKQAAMEAAGGPWGMVISAIPALVFAGAIAFVSPLVAAGIAIALAVVIAVVQLWRGKPFSSVYGGVLGVVIAGGIVAWTGSANDFFVIGIWAALVVGVVVLVTTLMNRPVTGVIWNAVHGGTHAWREDRPTLVAHHVATFAVLMLCVLRFAVQGWLYLADSTAWLAIADTVMGFPLMAVVAVVVIWAFRRSTKRLVESDGSEAAERG
ncbi:DUF3159 domain-containing protein [Nocardiopsis sp. HUAS JQ3]|uniref:DUF3159 domain-containing protein n=1 Tax=Nocardiopsis sp. HUAS JQ3 TaxID=3061629 RepID=UPI0023A923AF|nr:DUF3159 domain-containing protein [Nocardiopsis sp. HUAS JQ3]WDZ92764.1 DUF3159 domain-containing protein [Nocardiopsis sp. HUAS JQ3]